MELLEWQKRVIEEKAALDDKLGRLTDFLNSPATEGLEKQEWRRLILQEGHMQDYSKILDERIAAFK